MTVRQTRQLLSGLAAACAVLLAGVMWWAVSDPARPEVVPAKVRGAAQVKEGGKSVAIGEEQLASVWDRALQGLARARANKPVKPQTKARKPPRTYSAPNPRMELVATIFEGGRAKAIISDARGIHDVRGQGETLDLLPSGVTVSAIQRGSVTLLMRGRPVQLRMKGASAASAGMTRPNRNSGARENRGRRAQVNRSDDLDEFDVGDGPSLDELGEPPNGEAPLGGGPGGGSAPGSMSGEGFGKDYP